MRKLFWDCEMAPAVVHSWGLFDQNHALNQIVEDPYMLCFAARWGGSNKKIFKSVHHNSVDDMVTTLWNLLDEADAVVSWNGARFDTGHANREFKKAGLNPPSTYKEIDLLQTARGKFTFLSNKLDYVSNYLSIGRKIETGGHDLWVRCMDGDEAAWRKMKRYNIQDVDLLVEMEAELLPWITNYPNVNLYDGTSGCPRCGSDDIQKRGFTYTKVTKKQAYQCNSCKSRFTDKKTLDTAEYR